MSCGDYHQKNRSEQCNYIKDTASCSENDGHIHYLQFPYCDLPNEIPLADVILLIWIGYLFVCLAITAEDYFCPALTAISKMLKLSQNVAGVTFLALGNGSPDIFSCIVALGSGSAETTLLAFGAMFGAGLFVNTVVIGAVTLVQGNYDLARRPFFRDCIFYLAASYWTWYNCYKGKMNLYTGIGYIALYAVYVALVVIGRYIFQNYIKNRSVVTAVHTEIDESYAANEQDVVHDSDVDEQHDEVENLFQDHNEENWAVVPGVKEHALTRALGVAQTLPHLNFGVPHLHPVEDDMETPLIRPECSVQTIRGQLLIRQPSSYEYPSYSMEAFKHILKAFIRDVNPIHYGEWETFGLKDKIFDIIAVPGNIIFTVTIPVVDVSEPLNNWKKLLNAVQLLLCSLVSVLLLPAPSTLASVPTVVIAGLVGLLLMIVVLFTSSQGHVPIYFKPVYTLLGFVMSVIWIYTIANEIVSLLSAFGFMFNISSTILGLTVLSWANSVGDLVSDMAMAKQGFSQMAVSACIGGPCLNMLLGVGIASTLYILRTGESIHMKLSGSLIISSAFLIFALCSHIVVIPLMGFRVKKWYGVYLFVLYIVFMILALLNVTGVFTIG